jgi:L-rhamnose isomerase
MLEPLPLLRKYEDNDQLFERLAQLEEDKSMPWGAVYDEFCLRTGVPVGEEFIADIQKYEHDVLIKRV